MKIENGMVEGPGWCRWLAAAWPAEGRALRLPFLAIDYGSRCL